MPRDKNTINLLEIKNFIINSAILVLTY